MTGEDLSAAPRVRLFNLHTRKNLGDAAIVLGTIELLRSEWPSASIEAATRYSTDARWLSAIGASPVSPGIDFPGPGGTSDPARFARFGTSYSRAKLGLSGVAAPDLSLSNGGGYLFSRKEPELSLRHILAEIQLMSDLGPTILLPQTVGPIERDRDRRRMRRALAGIDHLFARDRASVTIAIDELDVPTDRVTAAPDLVFALANPATREEGQASTTPRAAITALDWRWAGGSTHQFEAYLEALASVAQSLVDREWHVDLRVQVDLQGKPGHDDAVEAHAIRGRMRDPARVEVLSAGRDPGEAIQAYSSYDVVIGTRLHSALMTLCAGVPAIALAYQPKATEIYSDLALSEWVLDARSVDPEELLAVVDSIASDLAGARRRVSRAVEGTRDELRRKLTAAFAPYLGPPERECA